MPRKWDPAILLPQLQPDQARKLWALQTDVEAAVKQLTQLKAVLAEKVKVTLFCAT